MEKAIYLGDVDIRYGGTWYDLSTWQDNYVRAVRVNDLDSAIGWKDAFLIEELTINIYADKYPSQVGVCGLSVNPGGSLNDNGSRTLDIDSQEARLLIADAVAAYGFYDNDSAITVVIGPDADMNPQESGREGWEASERLRSNVNLRKWVMDRYSIEED